MFVTTRIITHVSWSTTSLWLATTASAPWMPGMLIHGPRSATMGAPGAAFTLKKSTQAITQLANTTPQETNATTGFGSFLPTKTWNTNPKIGNSGTIQTSHGET